MGMTVAGTQPNSLRLSGWESRRLALALALSLAAHLLTWGGYEAGKDLGWWQVWHWPAWLQHLTQKLEAVPKPAVNYEPPLEFATVEQPSTEAPKNAKYYSDRNSRAANPDADQDTDTPKLNGKQTDVPKTEDVPRQDFNKLQPAPAAQQQPQMQLAMNAGDLTLGRSQAEQPQPRPRTLDQARAQQTNHRPGVQMRQEGGVHHLALMPSLDVRGTQFGEYDAAIFEAIEQYWNNELDRFARDRTGEVTIQFHLNYDGTVSDVKILDNNVGILLGTFCQDAIEGSAPYAKWPGDMRRMIGANYRQITIKFIYY
jgi:outer membrane biosynthesis protein TonB